MKHTKGLMEMEYDDTLCLGGQCMMSIVPDGATNQERVANHKRIMDLWNAAEGMSTEEAVKLINMEG